MDADTRAKQAYEETTGHDEAFDWLMEDVLAGMNDLTREPVCRRYDGGVTIQISQEASELLHRALEKESDPRDMVSVCVESVLGCVLDGSDPSFQKAIVEARARRLVREQEAEQKFAALRSWHQAKTEAAAAAGKEVAA